MHQSPFRPRLRPDPTGDAPPDPLVGLKDAASKGERGGGEGKKKKREEEENGKDAPFRTFLGPPLQWSLTKSKLKTQIGKTGSVT